MTMDVHHIALVVDDMDAALAGLERALGASHVLATAPGGGAKVAFVQLGNCELELVQPLGDEHPMMAWLAEKGSGIHHIALAVADADRAREDLSERGVGFVDAAPAPGARGSRIANLSPEGTAGSQFQIVQPGEE